MNTINFIEEVKYAVSGKWLRSKKPKSKISKTAEEICLEELNKPKQKDL